MTSIGAYSVNPSVLWEEVGEEVLVLDRESRTVHRLTGRHAATFLAVATGDVTVEREGELGDLIGLGLVHSQTPVSYLSRRHLVTAMAAGITTGALALPSAAVGSSSSHDNPPTLIAQDLSTANWAWLAAFGGFTVFSRNDLAVFDAGNLFVAGEEWEVRIPNFGEGLTGVATVVQGDPRRSLGFDVTSGALPAGTISVRIVNRVRNFISSPFDVSDIN